MLQTEVLFLYFSLALDLQLVRLFQLNWSTGHIWLRPSKCIKFYTTIILGKIELTPKRASFLSKLKFRHCGIIYKSYTKMHIFNTIQYKYLVNTPLKLKNNFCPSLSWTLKQKPKLVYKKTLYVLSHKFTPVKKILHSWWLWWLRHLEALNTGYQETKKSYFSRRFY